VSHLGWQSPVRRLWFEGTKALFLHQGYSALANFRIDVKEGPDPRGTEDEATLVGVRLNVVLNTGRLEGVFEFLRVRQRARDVDGLFAFHGFTGRKAGISSVPSRPPRAPAAFRLPSGRGRGRRPRETIFARVR